MKTERCAEVLAPGIARFSGGWKVLLAALLGVAASPPAVCRQAAEAALEAAAAKLHPAPERADHLPPPDWLITRFPQRAGVFRGERPGEVCLDNGLIRRTFRLRPECATVGLDNLAAHASLLRAVKPEASLTIDGKKFPVGGLTGQPDHAFLLPEWIPQLKPIRGAFRLIAFAPAAVEKPFEWKRVRHAQDLPWPPKGAAADFVYAGQGPAEGVKVVVHYELYDGIPLLGKWLTVSNGTDRAITLNQAVTELLAAVEAESAVDQRPTNMWRLPPISVISDYAFGGMDPVTSCKVAHWLPDPEYKTQVHYQRRTPCVLACYPPIGPGVRLAPGESWRSWRTWLLIHDSDGRERQGLAIRRAMRVLAPWCTENPIMMHLRRADSATFRKAVDQCADVGFEMIIYSFGSGINMENTNAAYLARIRADVDYARSKGIEVGAYSLLSSRRISDADDVISPRTGKPDDDARFGHAPCLGSAWAQGYFRKLKRFIQATGLTLLEHDGPYPGDLCASTNHPGHRGLEDSQWAQWKISADFYRWCRENGIYVNAPDFYFLVGTSKTGMGYRESNWSLPRALQILHGRQNIYDGTWEKTPTMGWMFVPLTQYHGGGAAATIEPLREHLPAYEAHLANNFGGGVQACYRGPRLYDAPETRELLRRWVAWFKKYRDILESDIIHLRRADGRDIDYFLHVNPFLRRRGLLMVYNPLSQEARRKIRVPLYYTGLRRKALVRHEEGPAKTYRLARDRSIRLEVQVPAQGQTWYLIEAPPEEESP
ncbi:MAG: alpha-galactosidase [Verrucomicrobia bacterium]|nr:alpha-galactosidase [Verrucomicrobiota bacterium]